MTLHWNTSFWTVIAVSALYGILYALPLSLPWSLLRIPPGLILLFYLPGHDFLRIFLRRYPVMVVERYVLEIGVSMFIMLVLGLLLNFTLFGLLAIPVIATIIGLNFALAGLASYDDYRNMHPRRATELSFSS